MHHIDLPPRHRLLSLGYDPVAGTFEAPIYSGAVPRIRLDGRTLSAARVAYAIAYGDIPPRWVVGHLSLDPFNLVASDLVAGPRSHFDGPYYNGGLPGIRMREGRDWVALGVQGSFPNKLLAFDARLSLVMAGEWQQADLELRPLPRSSRGPIPGVTRQPKKNRARRRK